MERNEQVEMERHEGGDVVRVREAGEVAVAL